MSYKPSGSAVEATKKYSVHEWRQRVPFHVPYLPEMMDCDPCLVHCTTDRTTVDAGVQFVDLKFDQFEPNGYYSLCGIERGVCGMSLRKHSNTFRMLSIDSYRGLRPPLPARNAGLLRAEKALSAIA